MRTRSYWTLAYKLGIAFCDHNHERKHALAGYDGVINFTREINMSLNSPVWKALSAPFPDGEEASA
jgi:nitrogenase molybdenum-cofactor synthesis protein NifE